MKVKMGKSDKVNRILVGGPWNNHIMPVPQSGTMVFSLGEWRGRYDKKGVWHDER